MSDNVKRPDDGSEQDNLIDLGLEPKKKKPLRIVLMAVIVLIVLGALIVLLFPGLIDFDAIGRYFRYIGKENDERYGKISYDASGVSAFGALGEGLALGTDSGVLYYDIQGEQVLAVQGAIAQPVLMTTEDRAVCYALGGGFVSVIDREGSRLMDQTLSGNLLDLDLSSDGYVCYNATESGYKTVTTVLNRDMDPMFRFRSSTQFLSACAISPGGSWLAVAGLSEKDSTFSATLSLMRTNEDIVAGTDQSETSLQKLSLGNQMVYEMAFLSSDRLCAVGQDTVFFIGTDGEIVARYHCGTSYLRGFSFGGKGYVTLLLGKSMTGDRYSIVTLDRNGETVGELELNRTVRSFSVRGSYIGVLTDSDLTVYKKDLKEYASTDAIGAASQVLMRSDGTALLVGNGAANLFLP